MTGIKPETEKKLLAVIEKTADFVNSGMGANEAVIKAASEAQIRPSEVSLVVQAYNTGRTNRQRQDGTDIFSKTAEFELADTEKVLEGLYPSTIKTASDRSVHDDAVSGEYSISPRPMLERKQRWEKKAYSPDWRQLNGQQIETPPPLPRDKASQLLKAAGEQQRRQVIFENARREKSAALDAASVVFRELTDYFRQVDAIPMAVVKEAAEILHGQKGADVIDQLAAVTPALTKLANHVQGRALLGVQGHNSRLTVDDIDTTETPFDKIASLLDQLEVYKQASATFARLEEAQATPPFSGPASPSVLDQSFEELEKRAFDPWSTLGAYKLVNDIGTDVARRVGGGDVEAQTQKRVGKVMNQLNDPSHELKLREINARASLQDMMLNDPIVSGYEPEQVAGAYNDIVQISPSVSDQRMLLQSLLRKHLQQGQLDTFEQDKLLGFEDSLRKQVQHSGKGGDGSVI
jgi:hypothetical protein